MESKDRRFVVKSRYDFANYRYNLNGKDCTRNDAINMILDVLDVKAMTINELAKMFKVKDQPMLNLIKVMRENNLIKNTKLRRNGNYLFKSHNDCLLAKHLYPSADDVEKSFNIKDRKVRKAEDGTAKSSQTNRNNIVYNGSYFDSVYWGD